MITVNITHLWGENLVRPRFRPRSRRNARIGQDASWRELLEPLPPQNLNYDHSFPGFLWSPGRGALLLLLSLCSIFVMYLRVFQLQVVSGAKNRFLSEQNRLRTQVIRPPRGIIYDREGRVLVENTPGFRVVWKPSLSSVQDALVDWEELAVALDMTIEALE